MVAKHVAVNTIKHLNLHLPLIGKEVTITHWDVMETQCLHTFS